MTVTTPRVVAKGRLVRLREKQLDDARRDYEWRKDRELAAYDATRPITMTYRAFVETLSEDLIPGEPPEGAYTELQNTGGMEVVLGVIRRM